MQEIYQITAALKQLPHCKHVAVLTDARFSGVSTGACIGHISPEALAGGPIGKVLEGDRIEIVIDRENSDRLRSIWWETPTKMFGAEARRAPACAAEAARRLASASSTARRHAPLGRAGAGQRRRLGRLRLRRRQDRFATGEGTSETLPHQQRSLCRTRRQLLQCCRELVGCAYHAGRSAWLSSVHCRQGRSRRGIFVCADSGAHRQPGSVGRRRHLLPQPQRAHGRSRNPPAEAISTIASIRRSARSFSSKPPPTASPAREHVRIRSDAKWSVPEPELTLLINHRGQIVGYTVGNDMSSRDIEGENPLYLPQAKVYDRSCALGPCVLISPEPLPASTPIRLEIVRGGVTSFLPPPRLPSSSARPQLWSNTCSATTAFPSEHS